MSTPYEPDLVPPGRTNVYGEQTLKCTLVFGNGALSKTKGKHLSAVRNSAGNITITLPRTYRQLTGFRWGWTKSQGGAGQPFHIPVVATDDVAGTGTLVIETRLLRHEVIGMNEEHIGVADDPEAGDELCVEFDLSNDVLNDAEYA